MEFLIITNLKLQYEMFQGQYLYNYKTGFRQLKFVIQLTKQLVDKLVNE